MSFTFSLRKYKLVLALCTHLTIGLPLCFQISVTVVTLLAVVVSIQSMVISSPVHTGYGTNRKSSHHKKRHGHNRHRKHPVTPMGGRDLEQFSSRVSLSQVKPMVPPVSLSLNEDMERLAFIAVEIDNNNNNKSEQHHRDRRSLSEYVYTSVCDSVSEWVEKMDAKDMWGNHVQVLQEIDIGGGVRVNQYFYETRCRQEKTACIGIDTHNYFSVCENKYVWAYAKVATRRQEVGWSLIKIRGSCNCALFKRKSKTVDIMDMIAAAASGKQN